MRTYLLAIILIGLAVWLRFNNISAPSFSVDESSSLYFASYPDWGAIFWDNHPPLYHLLLKFWLKIFSMTEVGARSLSVLFSVIGVTAFLFAGRCGGNFRRGFAAAGLLTGSCLSIRYAQEARMYAMMESLAVIQLAGLICLLQHPRARGARLAVACAAVFSALTHAFGLLSTLMLSSSLRARDRKLHRRAIVIALLGGLVFATGFIFFQFDARYVEWQRLSYHLSAGPFSNLREFLTAFAQQDVFVLIVMITAAAFSCFHDDPLQQRISRGIIVGFLAVVALGLIAEETAGRRILIARYFIFLNPFLIWSVTLGFEVMGSHLKRQSLRWAACVTAVAGFLVFTPNAFKYQKEDWRQLGAIAKSSHVSLVMSTRPRGLQMPYFNLSGLAYENFLYDSDFINVLRDRLKTYKRVMIVDTNLMGTQYYTSLLLSLNEARLPHSTVDLVNREAGSVFGILIAEPKN